MLSETTERGSILVSTMLTTFGTILDGLFDNFAESRIFWTFKTSRPWQWEADSDCPLLPSEGRHGHPSSADTDPGTKILLSPGSWPLRRSEDLCGTGAPHLADIQIMWQRGMTVFYGLRSDSSGCPPTPPPRPCCSSAITSMLLLLLYSSAKALTNEGLMSLRQSQCVKEDKVNDEGSLDSTVTSAGTRRARARALPAHLARRLLAVRRSSLSFFLSLSVLFNACGLCNAVSLFWFSRCQCETVLKRFKNRVDHPSPCCNWRALWLAVWWHIKNTNSSFTARTTSKFLASCHIFWDV